jgi:hypothetical protein
MKKILFVLSVALPVATVALTAEARPRMCGQIERCFGTNNCLDALIEAELLDSALLYYGENCLGNTVEV